MWATSASILVESYDKINITKVKMKDLRALFSCEQSMLKMVKQKAHKYD